MEQIIPFAGCFCNDPKSADICKLVFAGLACDLCSSFRHGSSTGPQAIRLAYDGRAYNSTSESGVDLVGQVADLGDWESFANWQETRLMFKQRATEIFSTGNIPFFAGGDHAVTVPVVQALSVLDESIHVVQIDAHPDLYFEYDGSRDSHGCVATRLLEMEHVESIIQIGIRTLNAEQKATAEQYLDRLTIIDASSAPSNVHAVIRKLKNKPVYFTIDLDGFDPAFAPGVAHPVPGGLSPRLILDMFLQAEWKLLGMDVVELNSALDVNNLTALLAARLLHEGMAHVFSSIR